MEFEQIKPYKVWPAVGQSTSQNDVGKRVEKNKMVEWQKNIITKLEVITGHMIHLRELVINLHLNTIDIIAVFLPMEN